MPPRYAYWTILIDGKATAFRAREREELLPTFNQLARKNADIVMRYFARGRLWDTPEQAQWAGRNPATVRPERRDRSWRPGGEHKDPRARFARKPAGAGGAGRAGGAGQAGRAGGAGQAGQAGAAGRAGGAGQAGERPKWPRKPQDRRFSENQARPERPKWQSKPGDKPSAPDRRPPRSDGGAAKRPGHWDRPPKRKPR
jgi:hypothetical protein